MSVDFGERRGVRVVGALVALVLVALFVSEVFFTLSITVRAALLLALTVLFLCGTARTVEWREFGWLALVGAFLSFVAYSVIQFDFSIGTVVGIGVGTVVVVIALTYLLHSGRLSMAPSTARYTVLAVLVVSAVLVGVDVGASDVTYDLRFEDEVRLGSGTGNGTVDVGVAEAETTFVFRESLSFPDVRACFYADGNRTTRSVFYPAGSQVQYRTIAGGESIRSRMVVGFTGETRASVNGSLPVERADACPEATDEDRLVVVVDPTDG